uniref:Uncharacterized protein n=1 Tax=Anopheles atroparvus TaxID=41427 RepID=A0AAG5CTG4_ANOAO
MNGIASVGLGLILLLAIAPQQHKCNPFYWFPQRVPATSYNQAGTTTSSIASAAQQQSNVSVSLGNRINTNTTLDDYGTRVDGVTVNVVRRRRRRRDVYDIPAIPSIPSSQLNGSYVAIGNQVFQLPDQLTNLSLNIASSSLAASSPQELNLSTVFVPTIPDNYTNAFQALVTQFESLSLDTMDNIVQFLADGYSNSFGQLFVENGFARLNQSLEYGRSVAQAALDNVAHQGAEGFEQLIRNFNASTSRVQRCVGNNLNPTNVSRAVVGRANACVSTKWQELSRLVGNIAEDIVAADHGAVQFLANLTACNGANFDTLYASSNAQRRQCYVQAVQSFPQSLLFLPVSLTIDTAQLYASIQSLQMDVAICGSQMALEIGLVTAQIGSKIVLCQVFPS